MKRRPMQKPGIALPMSCLPRRNAIGTPITTEDVLYLAGRTSRTFSAIWKDVFAGSQASTFTATRNYAARNSIRDYAGINGLSRSRRISTGKISKNRGNTATRPTSVMMTNPPLVRPYRIAEVVSGAHVVFERNLHRASNRISIESL